MKTCKIEGCKNKVHAKDYCQKHYKRFWRYGDPLFRKNIYEYHGLIKTVEYGVWAHMKKRCYNKNDQDYHRYGGRGITVCDRWKNSFNAFFKDIGKKPFPKAQIDRIDNDGNYEPGNCRWVTTTVNARNRSSNKLTMAKAKEIRITYKIGNIYQKELAIIYGVGATTISEIINNKTWRIVSLTN